MKELWVHAWHSQCGECRYGGESWADSPALEGKPILDSHSTECPNCGVAFTHRHFLPQYSNARLEKI